MVPSKHNIISKIKDSENYFIVNLLSRNADIIDPSKAKEFETLEFTNSDELMEKGYLVNPQEEDKLYRERYLSFVDNRETDEIQLFFVPWYACNFACSYCYQDEYEWSTQKLSTEITDAFFAYIKTNFSNRKKYITLFGGEPLLTSNYHKQQIEYILKSSKEAGLDVAIVTNGYHLADYIDILKNSNIREIQVTLDGTATTHNERRFLKDKSPTFANISDGIDALLQNNIPVNLRMVIDRENINNLPELARYCISKGWTTSPNFKTQLGRNYELHHCQKSSQRLYSRLELYQDLYRLINQYPEVIEFHKPAFSISKFLVENGELPDPLFDSCPACKTEWAFDFTGTIYSCTATVGKKEEELGSFYPAMSLKVDKIGNWQDRDVLAITECKNCPVQLACGGGCGSIAKNQKGSILKPDCRPVKELMELGIGAYFKE
jgi:uncharacterized protein